MQINYYQLPNRTWLKSLIRILVHVKTNRKHPIENLKEKIEMIQPRKIHIQAWATGAHPHMTTLPLQLPKRPVLIGRHPPTGQPHVPSVAQDWINLRKVGFDGMVTVYPWKGTREAEIEPTSFGRTPRTERKSVGNAILNASLREKSKSIQPRM